MKSLLSYLVPISLLLSFIGTPATAQVTADDTTDTTVNADGNDFTIQDGDTAGSNLFHSFQDFSVPNGGSAFFDNAEAIENIFSRVTGGNISNIDGLIRANDANLFLINPAGIIFGAGARLDLGGGSFYGSSADSILFEDGEFSATDLDNPPLITVNAPIGLSFRDSPGTISNNSVADDLGLQVASEATLALLGGEINFTGGIIDAPGANVFLGGLSEAGTINLDENLNPSFPTDVTRADVSFSEAAQVIVTGDNGGSITVTGNNLEFTEGSELLGGIAENGGASDSQAGDISLDATGSVSFSGESNIENRLNAGGTGNSGNIDVNAESLSLTGGSYFSASTFSTGNAGNINVDVVDAVELSGETENEISRFSSVVAEGAEGDGGDITINASSVSIEDNALLNVTVFAALEDIPAGVGDAGNINVITDSFSLSNEAELRSDTSGNGNAGNITIDANNNLEIASSRINSSVQETAVGQGGNITLTGSAISLSDGSLVGSVTFPNGEDINGEQVEGGDIELNISESLSITGNSSLLAATNGIGNAGNIAINGEGADIVIEDVSDNEEGSGSIFSSSNNVSGDAGDIDIAAQSLTLRDPGFINSSALSGTGDGGDITINVAENIDLTNFSIGSDALSNEENIPTGNAGNLIINAGSLSASDNSLISSSTFGSGNAGDITVSVDNNLELSGSRINSNVQESAAGQGGKITLTANSILLSDNTNITALTFPDVENLNQEQVRGGDIELNVSESLRLTGNSNLSSSTTGVGDSGNIAINGEGANIVFENNLPAGEENADSSSSGSIFSSSAGSIGNAGDISIAAQSLAIADSGTISSTAFGGEGDGGDIVINVAEDFVLTDSTISSDAAFDFAGNVGTGNAGNLTINADSLSSGNSSISSSTLGSGNAGNINIDVNSFSLSGGLGINNDTSGAGNAGNITINANNIDLVDTRITSNVQALASGQGGQITITGDSISLSENTIIGAVTFPDGESINSEEVTAGNIELNVSESLRLTDNSSLVSSTAGKGDAGNITINAEAADIVFEDNVNNEEIDGSGSIFSSTLGSGDAGDINITANSLTLRDAGIIDSSTFANGDAGNITIDVQDEISLSGFVLDDDIIFTVITSAVSNEATGNAGEIEITSNSLNVSNRAQINTSTFGNGNAGNIALNINDAINLERSGSISSNVGQQGIGDAGNIDIQTGSLTLNSGGQISTGVVRAGFEIPGGVGDGGNISINATDFVDISGFSSEQLELLDNSGDPENTTGLIPTAGFSSGLLAISGSGATGDAGNINVTTDSFRVSDGGIVSGFTSNEGLGGNIAINANILEATNGGQITTTTNDIGDAGTITINVSDQIDIAGSDPSFESRLARANEFGSSQGGINIVGNQGAESGIFANTSSDSTGNGGSISIGSGETGVTNEINLSDGGRITADSQGSGNGGAVTIRANNLSLDEAEILAETSAEQPQDSSRSEINLFVDETLTLRNNSTISAQASNNASGGNVNIDAGFIVAFPAASGDGNDILARASGEGIGGDINIETQQIFGLEERPANANNASNDLDASSEFGLDGNVTITIFDPTAIEGATELPSNTVEAEAIAANVCAADNNVAEASNLTIGGKGGIPPEPTEPLSSDVINTVESTATNDSETNDAESVSIDDIVPARGVKVTEDGQVILTAYPIDSQGDRLAKSTPNCL